VVLDAIDLGTAPRPDSDAALAARASAGDALAFEQLHARWAGRVLRVASARLGCLEDAEDVAQDVFLALHRGAARYEGRSSFGTWLLGIAYHLTCRRLRQRARASSLPLAAVDRSETPTPDEGRLDAARALARCAEFLSADVSAAQRAAVLHCVGAARPAEGAPSPLARRPETVRAQLMRARRKLRERVPGVEDALVP
jgi:RNA polymerase sigma-70 factor (ECF subfamily)